MKVTLIPGQELKDDLACVWIRLQQSNADLASPYFHPEFTKAIAAARTDVEVAILETDGQIVAFFPFQRGHGNIGRPVGDIISDYHGLICTRDFQFSPRELLQHSQLCSWHFDHLIASQLSFAPFRWFTEESPQINISSGYNAYVQERHPEDFQQVKAKMRRLEEKIGPLRFVEHSFDVDSLEKVLGWKSIQYRRTGNPDLFAAGWIREAIRHIFTVKTDGFTSMLSLLYAGDRTVAGHFGMRSGLVWHYWFPSYDLEVAQYSPGLILLLKMVEHAPKIGVPLIDLGKGTSAYKKRLMNASSLLATGRLESSWRSISRKTCKALRSQIALYLLGPAAPAKMIRSCFRSNSDKDAS